MADPAAPGEAPTAYAHPVAAAFYVGFKVRREERGGARWDGAPPRREPLPARGRSPTVTADPRRRRRGAVEDSGAWAGCRSRGRPPARPPPPPLFFPARRPAHLHPVRPLLVLLCRQLCGGGGAAHGRLLDGGRGRGGEGAGVVAVRERAPTPRPTPLLCFRQKTWPAACSSACAGGTRSPTAAAATGASSRSRKRPAAPSTRATRPPSGGSSTASPRCGCCWAWWRCSGSNWITSSSSRSRSRSAAPTRRATRKRPKPRPPRCRGTRRRR